MTKLVFLKSAIPSPAEISDDTLVWIWVPKGNPVSFYESLSDLKRAGLLLRNIVYLSRDSHNGLSYDVLAFLTKSMDYQFYKDPIRIESRWQKHEFGNGKRRANGRRPYHEKGKDPSNAWVEEVTKGSGPYVDHIRGISIREMFRRVLLSSSVKGDTVITNTKEFLDFARAEDRDVRRIKGRKFRTFEIERNGNGKVLVEQKPPLLNNTYVHDSRKTMAGLENQVDLVITSPPYYRQRDYGYDAQIGQEGRYEEYLDNLRQVLVNCYHYLKDVGFLVLNINNFMEKGSIRLTHWHIIQILMNIGYKYHDTLIWFQPNSRRGLNAKNVCDAKEYLIVVSKNGKEVPLGDRMLRFPQLRGSLLPDGGAIHPAMFPSILVKHFVELLTEPNALILDPFMGSGTVAKSAQELGRRWIGFELNPDYNIKIPKC